MSGDMSLLNSTLVQGAYKSSKGLSAAEEPLSSGSEQKANFADLVQDATGSAIASLREAEATAQAGMVGAVNTQELVEATIALESTVKIAVSMRDKLVAAYQEILRMPI